MRNVDVESDTHCCRGCRRTLPRTVDYFYRDAACAFGLKLTCRDCLSGRARRRYAENSAVILERQRRRRQERAEMFRGTAAWTPAAP